ncbi:TraB/GumN family protein [Niveibacterium microcysteis]|uniref:TraB/GumN family protein n=1 Tax=Niveibacterium microcysteis TaxID=2811415 RepID=A0ABX7M1V2_9RHOO|nr:TraB/GumN family protein [Niveibacterium microcysteis]QSI75735.1 TraB/GumN family protein [Niveibacterium microcysteis]
MNSLREAADRVRHSRGRGGLLRALSGVLCISVAFAAQAAPLLLWEVSGGAAPMWLFGSVHVCRADCFPLPAAVESKFRRAEVLAVEVDATRADIAGALGDVSGGGAGLREQLGNADWRRLVKQLSAMGMPEESVDALSPAMANVFVAVAAASRAGLSPLHGIDLHFINRAQHDGKALVELETVERQMQALAAGSEREQIESLRSSLKAADDGSLRASLDELVGAWRRGDANGLAEALRKAQAADPSSRAMFEELFDRRNREMTDAIAKLAREGRPAFVVIGSGHLAGREAIPALLARRGFRVRQLSSSD